jgi:predicted AlkP superfamily phosphohydrolase/phosphomutase
MGIFKKSKSNFKPKSVVVGLDGVPFSLLANLRKSGIIPNMSSIFDNGYFGQMRVSIPEISSVSWSSFMTGKQSGEHGIYGFIDLEPGTYNMFLTRYL